MKNTAKKLATTTAKKKPTNITEYIQTTPKDMQMKLRRMRDSIRSAAPKAEEGLKWGMPAFSHK
jgi:uncharacterized protein YdhG (YjbR/CyaY superfamily)